MCFSTVAAMAWSRRGAGKHSLGNACACEKNHVTFWSRPAEIRERAPRPVRGTVEGRRGLAILEPLASRFFFTLRLPISIVDAKAAAAAPSSQVAAHRLPPTPRAPPEPPPHAAAPPLHVAASSAATPRQLPPTPAVETHSATSARRPRRQQRRTRNQTQQTRNYAGGRLQNRREARQGRLLPGLQS